MPNAATGLLSDLFVWTYEMNDSDDQFLVNVEFNQGPRVSVLVRNDCSFRVRANL